MYLKISLSLSKEGGGVGVKKYIQTELYFFEFSFSFSILFRNRSWKKIYPISTQNVLAFEQKQEKFFYHIYGSINYGNNLIWDLRHLMSLQLDKCVLALA